MRIISVNTNQQQPNFQARKLPNLKVKPRLKKPLAQEQNEDIHYTQAILFALAFCAATLTKYFIEQFHTKHKSEAKTEIKTEPTEQYTDTNVYKFE